MDLQSTFSKKIGDKQSISIFIDKAKSLFFTVTMLLINNEEQSLPLNCVCITIHYFQITYLLFSQRMWNVWKNNVASYRIHQFLSSFLFSPYPTNFSTLIVVLYCCIGIFAFAVMLLFFVGLKLNKKKIENSWLVWGLKVIINLFLSVLYLPIIDTFVSIINCNTINDTQYHALFGSELCWQGTHILHGTMSIVIMVCFYIFCISFALIYYEPKYNPLIVQSKQSGRPLAILLTYELIQSLVLQLISNEAYQYFQIVILLAGSLIIFQKFHLEQPHNHKFISKIWSVVVTLNVWGAMLLCCSKFLEGIIFNGILYAFIAGLPLLALSIARIEKLNFDLLLINHSKVSDPQDIIDQTNYLIKLLHFIKTDTDAQIIVDGYLEIHRVTCVREDCYLKIKNQPNIRLTNALLRDNSLSERETDLIFVLGQIYYNQIKKFPESITLRLRYSFLLADYMKQLQQAYNELSQCEQKNPQYDEEFAILRKKILIQEQLDSFQNENFGKVDVASEITFQNNYRLLSNYIEQATLAQMDFWSMLQEDSPDLGKIYLIGQKINKLLTFIEEVWIKIQKGSQNISKAMRLYGKFINDVLQDEDYGEELLKRAEIYQQQIQQNKKQIIQFFGGDDISYDQQATVIVSTQIEKFALVTTLNQSCCHMIGYTKQEIINRKINLFMPNLYAKFHDQYIERFLLTSDIKNINKDRFIFLKDKQNYIIPSFIVLRILHTVDENVNLAAQFMVVKSFKPTCYFIIDLEYIIDSISSTAISIFGLDNKNIINKKVSIEQLFPEITDNLQVYLQKFGSKIKYQPSNFQKSIQSSNANFFENELEFNCSMREIINITTNEVMGYSIKMELCESEQQSNELKIPHKHLPNNLQFKYVINQMIYQGDFVDELNNSKIDQSIMWDQGDASSMGSSLQNQQENTNRDTQRRRTTIKQYDEEKIKIDYGENIRTLRLFENKVQEIDDRDNVISEDEDRESVFQVQQDLHHRDDKQDIENNIFRSRKNLQTIITSQVTPKVIVKVNWISNLITLILITLSFIDYFLSINQYDEVYNTILLVRDGNFRNSEFGIILSSILNLQLQHSNVFNLTTEQATLFETTQKTNINDSINLINDLNQEIQAKASSMTAKTYNFEYNDVIIKMQLNEGLNQNYDLSQAIQQILSKSLAIKDKKLSQFTQSDSDIQFVSSNLLNNLQLALKQSSNNFMDNLINKTIEKINVFVILLVISICSINVGLLLLIVALLSVSTTQSEIVSLFLGIPDKTIRYLYHKSENFLSNLQIGEDDDLLSDLDDLEKEEGEQLSKTLKSKRTKKHYKNTNQEYRYFMYTITIILIIVQGYFILTYFLSGGILDDIHIMSEEFNLTTRSEQFYRFAEICQRELLYSRNQTTLNQDPYETMIQNQDELYIHDSTMQQYHSLNDAILPQVYLDTFTQLFIQNPCDLINSLDSKITIDECNVVMDSALAQGMNVGVPRFFENLRYLRTIYDQFYGFPKANFTTLARGYGTFRNITKNNDNSTNFVLNLNNFIQAQENRNVQHRYFKTTFRYLVNQFIVGLNDQLDNLRLQRVAIFIVFLVLLFLVYFFLWLPLVQKMTKDIWSTRSMILMIPLKIVQRIRVIKDYIRNNIQQGETDV